MKRASAARAAALCMLLAPRLAPAANLVENGSFEAGIDHRLAVARWYVQGLSAAELDPDGPVHGAVSLKVPFTRLGQVPGEARIDGIGVRGAVPVALHAGQVYALSAFTRTDAPADARLSLLSTPPNGQAEVTLKASPEVRIGRSWRRLQLDYRAERDETVYWAVEARSDQPGHLWLDALQLETGEVTEFRPSQAIEATIAADREGRIFDSGESPTLHLRAVNHAGSPAPAERFRLDVRDLSGTLVHERTITGDLPARGTWLEDVMIPALPNGIYRATLRREGREQGPASEVHFSVLPPPRALAARGGAFGIYATLAPEPLRILRRAGFSWLGHLTSNGPLIYWDNVEPEPGRFVWHDDQVALARSLGFAMMFNLEPCRTPRWARDLPRAQRLQLWTRYVRALAAHYGEVVDHWTIADEAHGALETGSALRSCWTGATEYLPWHLAGVEALRSADPGSRVLLNAQDQMAAAILQQLPAGAVDILADNSWHAPANLRRARAVAARYGIAELWAPGVAIPTPPWYRDLDRGHPEADAPDFWTGRNRALVKAVVESLALGARRIFHYTGTHVGNTNFYSLFEADSGLKPIGAQFAALAWLVDGAARAGEIRAGSADAGMRAFRFDRRDGQSVFALWGGAVARQVVSVPGLGTTPIAAYDAFANPLPLRSQEGGIVLEMNRDAVFLSAKTGIADRIETALAGLAAVRDAPPDGSRIEQSGPFAVIHGVNDGLWRAPPNVSLWFRSERLGWREILRHRSSDQPPRYRVAPRGFVVEWDFERPPGAFILGPGQFPAGLAKGARWQASRPARQDVAWRAGRVDAGSGRIVEEPSSPGRGGGAGEAGDLVFELTSAEGLRIRFATELGGAPAAYGEQSTAFGGWDFLARPGDDYFLHRYYPPAAGGRMKVTVRIEVTDAAVAGAPLRAR